MYICERNHERIIIEECDSLPTRPPCPLCVAKKRIAELEVQVEKAIDLRIADRSAIELLYAKIAGLEDVIAAGMRGKAEDLKTIAELREKLEGQARLGDLLTGELERRA